MALHQRKAEEMHVLLVAWPSQGHLNPMLRLAKRLASEGIQITVATTELARERMLISNTISTITTTTSNSKFSLEFFSDGLSLDYDRSNNLDHYIESVSRCGPQNLSNLIGDRKFSCIINNPFVPWVADVAEQHGIPCAMLWIQPCALYTVYYHYFNQLNSFPTQTDPNIPVVVPGLPLLKNEDLPSFILPSNPLVSVTKLLSQVFKNKGKLKWVLANSFYELEKDVVESIFGLCPIRPIGPLVPSVLLGNQESDDNIGVDLWKPDETCIKWLDQKPASSVIYVSFGSLIVLSRKQMKNLAYGLKDSNCSFLWVVKPPDHKTNDGEGQLPPGFLEEIEGQGLVVQWCPQIEVLMHPAISCFVTHCGWNSTLETVTCGIPVIAFPHWTDQPTNAKLIEDVFRIGVRIRADEDGLVSQEEVERCIMEIREGPEAEEIKNRAVELKEAARRAVRDGGSSYRNIQLFIDEIRAHNPISVSSNCIGVDQS